MGTFVPGICSCSDTHSAPYCKVIVVQTLRMEGGGGGSQVLAAIVRIEFIAEMIALGAITQDLYTRSTQFFYILYPACTYEVGATFCDESK